MKMMRVQNVLAELREAGIRQMILTDPNSIFYLTGQMFAPGSRLLALYISDSSKPVLFLNRLFPVTEDEELEICRYSDTDDISAVMAAYTDHGAVLGVDRRMMAQHLLALQELGAGSGFRNVSFGVDKVRGRKDEEERQKMREASQINDAAMARFKELIHEGVTELEVARQVEDIYKSLGADGVSFGPIISFGSNAAIPHHKPDNTVLKPGDSIIFDVGCRKEYYCSDMTRTFFYRSVSQKAREVYELVLKANQSAEAVIRPGMRFCDIDRAARGVIEEGGHGSEFIHRLGHSIGIEVHEAGDANPVNTDTVQPGNIFSCEPGVYLQGSFGVRIEDLCMVTEDGVEILNRYPKELQIIE